MARKTKAQVEKEMEYAELVYDKYASTHTIEQMADKAGVTPKTFSKWIEENGWDTRRAAFIISKDQELKRLYAQINELNTAIESREPGQRYANSKEADALKKLSSAAKDLESDLGISETINVVQSILLWMQNIDYDASIKFNRLADLYIKSILP